MPRRLELMCSLYRPALEEDREKGKFRDLCTATQFKGLFSYCGAWCGSGTPLPFTKCALKTKRAISENLVSDRPIAYSVVKGLPPKCCIVRWSCLWILFTQCGSLLYILYFTLLYFTYITLLYFTLLYFSLLYVLYLLN